MSISETLISTGEWKAMICEACLNMVFPTPWTIHIRVYFDNEYFGLKECYYHVNEILTLILMLRVLLIFRTIIMCSKWYGNRS